jgi:hypothetical protein
MERDNNRYHTETLVRKITDERERFVSAWEDGADSVQLNQIRQNIQQLNDLLWDASSRDGAFSQRTITANDRNLQDRRGPNRNS